MNQKVFTATQARQHFFELLDLAQKGEDPIILKKHQRLQFRVTLEKPTKKIDKIALIKSTPSISFGKLAPKQMKAIFESRLNDQNTLS